MLRKTEKKHRGVFEVEPGSGVWWIRYHAPGDPNPKREKVGRKSDAISLYQQRKSEVRAGAKLPANLRFKGERLSAILDRADLWYRSHHPKSSRDACRHLAAFKRAMGDRVAADLTATDIDTWISSHEDWTPATMNRYKATLSRALQLAVKSGHLHKNVGRLVTIRRENNWKLRWLQVEEEERIVASITKLYPNQLPAFLVALHTGMRKSEQFSLRWKQVDLKHRLIRLHETKSGHGRVIPINKTCLEALQGMPRVNEHVFQSARFEGRHLRNPRSWWDNVLQDTKVEDFRWHDLRHTFCSRLVMKGVDIRTVAELAGHRSIAITMRYAHLAPEHNLSAIEKLDAVPAGV